MFYFGFLSPAGGGGGGGGCQRLYSCCVFLAFLRLPPKPESKSLIVLSQRLMWCAWSIVPAVVPKLFVFSSLSAVFNIVYCVFQMLREASIAWLKCLVQGNIVYTAVLYCCIILLYYITQMYYITHLCNILLYYITQMCPQWASEMKFCHAAVLRLTPNGQILWCNP